MHPEIGAELGIRQGDLIADKYRVDRVLGVGGMGVVVAAHHLRLDELVAIKLLLPEALADADAVRRFEREARAAVKIKSEHVARIIDVGTLDDGVPFIVMEYLQGEDLADRVARTGPLAVEDAIELLLQACEAIAEAHALGIVHRDLKPANLFCVHGADGRPSIKVLDFGISKLTRAGAASSGLSMTKTRAVMGSPYYMSPEQMESPRRVDARTDIWSLGIVLYQLLTGEVPFAGETLPQVCVNVATRPAPPLRKARPDVPNGLEAIGLRCLEKDPNKRFPTVAALATALGRFGPRRAQASLDRITRTWRQAEGRLLDDAGPGPHQMSARAVTGPLPSWGGTAKSLEGRTKSIVGWIAGALTVVAVGFTFAYRESPPSAPTAPAVLVTPAPATESKEPPSPPTASAPEGVPIAAPPAKLPSVGAAPALARPAAPPAQAVADTDPNPYGAAPETPPPAPVAPTCLLNLNSMPAAKVVLDGMPIGFTPKMGVIAPAGEHHVLFRGPDGDKRATFTCAKGETKTVAVRLNEPPSTDDLPAKNPYR